MNAEQSLVSPILQFMNQPQRHYFTNDGEICDKPPEEVVLEDKDIILYRVDEMTFEEKAPRKEALENVLSAVRVSGVNFLYLLVGNQRGVTFYYGLSKAPEQTLESNLHMREIGNNILKSSLKGNFRGCQIEEVAVEEKQKQLSIMRKMRYMSRIEGVAGSIKDNEEFQSVDRLVDIMQGTDFCLLIVSQAIQPGALAHMEQQLHQAYSALSPYTKWGVQQGTSDSYSTSHSDSKGVSDSVTNGTNNSKSSGSSTQKGNSSTNSTSNSVTNGTNTSKSSGSSTQTGSSSTHGTSDSNCHGTNKSQSDGTSTQKSSSSSNSSTSNSTTHTGSTGSSESNTHGTSTSNGSSSSSSTSQTDSTGSSESNTHGTSTSNGSSSSSSTSQTDSTGNSESNTHGTSTTTQEGSSNTVGTSRTDSREYLDKCAQEWIKYCDDVVFPRLDYGKGKGVFLSACYVMTGSKSAHIKLENAVVSLYSGKQGNRLPLRAFLLNENQNAGQLQAAQHCQLPRGCFTRELSHDEQLARALLEQQPKNKAPFPLCNWISTNELSMVAGLPRKEVIGMRLREQVEFGLNYPMPEAGNRIDLGHLVQSGTVMERSKVYLDQSVLDKHLFIAGVTGSGKTTTCHKILLQSKLPFMVIEPAKTEYRILANKPECRDILIFTLGNDEAAPFRLNPFEFMPMESIASHVDMLKASMEAAFDMEAAIPQLMETALYRCYEESGWDVETNRNSIYADPFAPDVCAFPRLSDMLDQIETVVVEQGFDDRLRDEYIGSIRARLQSLTLGAKGMMLNALRSIDFDELLDRKVILELESIKNGDEKALIMSFILSNLHEAVRERYIQQGGPHTHILLVEEAHRLLSKFTPGDSRNKKQGVEVFCDMLAEIRKYGECLIIVDQIPNKLAPDVLKNTNTKLIHRIFAQDDKEAVGNTMSLNDDQKRFLSNLETGRAVMFSDHFGQALLVQIEEETKTAQAPLLDSQLTERAMRYYLNESNREIFMPISTPLSDLLPEQRRQMWEVLRRDLPVKMLEQLRTKKKTVPEWGNALQQLLEQKMISEEIVVRWMNRRFFSPADSQSQEKLRLAKLGDILKNYHNEMQARRILDQFI